MKKIVFSVLFLAALYFIIIELFFMRIPPKSRTFVTLRSLERQVIKDSKLNGTPLHSLSELSSLNGHSVDEIKDAWGNKILYSLVDGEAELRSYGADGLEGGEGDDADLVVRFSLKEFVTSSQEEEVK